MNYLHIADQKKMIGQTVTAVGTCGEGDGVTVEGRLLDVSPYPTVMVTKNGRSQPYAVNGQTLKLSPRVYN